MTFRRKLGQFGIAATLLLGTLIAVPVGAQVASAAPAPVQSVSPARLVDTRPGEKTIDGLFAGAGRVAAGSVTEVKIAGRGGVPSNATAALMNLTSVLPAANTYLTVYPCGTDRPNVSTLNLPGNDIRANSAFVKLSGTGTVCVYTVAATDFIIDVNGFVPAAGSPTSVNPVRLFDSRPGEKTVDGQYAGPGRVAAGSVTEVKIAGRGGVAADASAAVINLTSVLPSVGNYLTAYPCGTARPNVSNLNSPINDIRANSAFVKLSPTGTICVYTVYATDFVIDINGFVPVGGAPTSLDPARLFDSRPGEKTIDGQYAGPGRVAAGSTTEVKIAGRGGVAANATAAVINLTSVLPVAGNYLTAFPCGASRPNVSNLNSPPSDIRANSAFVQLSATGTVCVYSVAATDFIIDINGYATSPTTSQPILFNCNINGVATPSSIPDAQCQALAALYNKTGGAKWRDRTNWMTNTNPCTWKGITCADGNVTQIGLFNNSLTGALPAEIGNLPGLATLDVGLNGLTSLPAELVKLTNLRILKVGYNPFPDFPPVIGSMANLTELGYDGIKMLNLPTAITNLPNLTKLDISDDALATLPPSLANLTKLRTLDVGSNYLSNFPPVIAGLPSLVELWYSGNNLGKYPTQLNAMTRLTRLSLFGNQIPTVPAEIGNLTNLETLFLDDNQLTSLPPQIANLTKLTQLGLSGNRLNSYPSQINNLTNLSNLDLNRNSIPGIPSEIGRLTNLTSLTIGDNQLTSLPAELGNLTKLLDLGFANNKVTTIPIQVGNLPTLINLYAQGNQLSGDITGVFTPMMNRNVLITLSLSGNKCLTTTNPALANWLTAKDPKWKSAGCP